MSKFKKDDDLMNFLSPFVRMWENHLDKTYNQLCREWDRELESTTPEQAPSVIFKNYVWSFINLILFRPIKFILNWFNNRLKKNNVFEKRTLKRLKKLELLRIDNKVGITLLPAPIDPIIAQALICILSAAFGILVGWIIFAATVDFKLIVNSFVAGMVIGTLISLITDLSYERKEIYQKLDELNINPFKL